MKKCIIISWLSLLITSSAVAQTPASTASRQGLYFGGVVGQQNIHHDMRQYSDKDSFIRRRFRSFSLNDSTVTGGVLLGYGLEYMKIYWGIEADALFGQTKARADLNNQPDNDNIVIARMKTSHTFGGALRIGKNLGGYLFYTRLGLEKRKFTASLLTMDNDLTPPPDQINHKKSQIAFVPGVGVEIPVMAGLSARFEAREAFYKAKSTTSVNDQSKLTWRTRAITLLAGLTYKTGLGDGA